MFSYPKLAFDPDIIIYDMQGYCEHYNVGVDNFWEKVSTRKDIFPVKEGFCDIEKKEIWIFEDVIYLADTNLLTLSRHFTKEDHDLLKDVILDELTHIKSGKDHKDKEYNDLLNTYMEKCK